MPFRSAERRAKQLDEDYLKTILLLQKKKGVATPVEMAKRLGVTPSNVYTLLTSLEGKGYLIFEKGTRHKQSMVTLTEAGLAITLPVIERHECVQRWLMQLGVAEEEADQEACLLEHGLSDTTMAIIRRHVEMASTMFGHDIAYPEKMKMMMERIQPKQDRGRTEMEKIFNGLDVHGGYEYLVENGKFVRALGGQKQITVTMEQVEALGGLTEITKQMEAVCQCGGAQKVLHLHKKVKELGGIEKATKVVDLVNQIGGQRNLQRAVALNQKYQSMSTAEQDIKILAKVKELGGMRQIERKLMAVERLGGLQNMERLGEIAQNMAEIFYSKETD